MAKIPRNSRKTKQYLYRYITNLFVIIKEQKRWKEALEMQILFSFFASLLLFFFFCVTFFFFRFVHLEEIGDGNNKDVNLSKKFSAGFVGFGKKIKFLQPTISAVVILD